jgi:hypothetical protein
MLGGSCPQFRVRKTASEQPDGNSTEKESGEDCDLFYVHVAATFGETRKKNKLSKGIAS